MKNKITHIDAGTLDTGRPKERPPKTNWQIRLLIKLVGWLQHLSSRLAAKIVWHHFTKPGRSRFNAKQKSLISKAELGYLKYKGQELHRYRWGSEGPRILLSHGWNSKIADFRKMIEGLVDSGFVVEGIDMVGHGNSEGTHTALPEIRDILRNYYLQSGPFHAVIGYSIGGIAAAITVSEIAKNLQPKQLFIIAAPSFTRYFFKDTIDKLGYKESVYKKMCGMVNEVYHQSIDYFDLRKKQNKLGSIDMHLVYDEGDATVPFQRGIELREAYPKASFVHTKGMGHYQVIAHKEVINYIKTAIEEYLFVPS
ncbi:MAG: alpha/beta hydrolase [Cyclobacteriaceae bacterium]|nr:alpha/beta hydrolase [Cyclobacteriaceae bacterium HetDA_MAG_MS6]